MCSCVSLLCFFFFFKQKTAYEMRISDWSSDVCSSDLRGQQDLLEAAVLEIGEEEALQRQQHGEQRHHPDDAGGDARKEVRLGPDAEGKERCSQHEEQHRKPGAGARAKRQAEDTPDNPAEAEIGRTRSTEGQCVDEED